MIKFLKPISAAVVTSLALFASASALAAPNFTFSVDAAHQGKFKGDQGNTGLISGTAFVLQVESPRDPATGMATGKRRWQPIVITKEWSASSPQFLTALATNEELKTVTIEFEK